MGNLADNIKKFRTLSNLTQEQLASMLGKSKNVISNWERGDNKPDSDIIEDMCRIFKIAPNQLYGWESIEQPQTIAAHFSGDEYTEDELREIRQFAEFVKNKKK